MKIHINHYLLSSEVIYLLIVAVSSKLYPNYGKNKSIDIAYVSVIKYQYIFSWNENLEIDCFDIGRHQMKTVKALSMKYWSGN